MATAILERKVSKNTLIVDDASNDDHSVVALPPEKMLELDIAQVSQLLRPSRKAVLALSCGKAHGSIMHMSSVPPAIDALEWRVPLLVRDGNVLG